MTARKHRSKTSGNRSRTRRQRPDPPHADRKPAGRNPAARPGFGVRLRQAFTPSPIAPADVVRVFDLVEFNEELWEFFREEEWDEPDPGPADFWTERGDEDEVK
ncbi:MAG: hypothetical protein K8T25_01155 [Planctomycetia bacterium]|nr:hypothetical protein [Planctomycetia bacterium]